MSNLRGVCSTSLTGSVEASATDLAWTLQQLLGKTRRCHGSAEHSVIPIF